MLLLFQSTGKLFILICYVFVLLFIYFFRLGENLLSWMLMLRHSCATKGLQAQMIARSSNTRLDCLFVDWLYHTCSFQYSVPIWDCGDSYLISF
jgi:hypothetical protein